MKIYELTARFDARKSFYGKAHVIDHENGVIELQSYNTIVSRCVNGVVEHLGRWSQTTSRHQREFEKQFSY
jgi:hypothetical protein